MSPQPSRSDALLTARPGRFDYTMADPLSVLPKQCVIGMPELVAVAYGHTPCRQYEGLIIDLLARGNRVPGHPSACQAQAAGRMCGHASVWHRHRTRTHPCEVPGCGCLEFVRRSVP